MPALKNQHFVPKCLLRPFAIDGNGRSINLYNFRHRRAITMAPIKGQCAREYFYGTDGEMEKILSKVEGHYGALMKRIIGGTKENERALDNLRFFTYLQLRRTEMAVERSRFMFQQMHYGVFENDIDAEPMPSYHDIMMSSLKLCMDTHNYISDLKPRLIKNETKMQFIISDDPAVMTNRFAFQRLKKSDFGVGSSGALLLMPLTPRLCFVCYDGNVYTAPNTMNGRIILKKETDVAAINEFQYLKAGENIYFSRWDDREYVEKSFAAVQTRRLEKPAELMRFVPDGIDEHGERYVLGTRAEAKQAGRSFIQLSVRHAEPARWPSVIQYRSKPKTFYNGTLIGHVRKEEWLRSRFE